MLIGTLWAIHNHANMATTLSARLATEGQSFLFVKTLCAFVIDQIPFTTKQNMQAGRTKPAP
jgi:hypothetical protein